jgi:lipid-binding SYLF domain-containing protein
MKDTSSRAKRGILVAVFLPFTGKIPRSLRSLGMRCRIATLFCLAAPGFPAPSTPLHVRDESDARAVIAKFKEKDPGMVRVFAEATGFAVFPTVGKGAIGIGGARGKGYVYEHGKLIGRSTLTQVSIGFQLGGQAYSEVVFLKDKAAMDSFKKGRLKLDAQASAVALTARAAGDLPYRDGVAIVTMAKGGLMYEASVGGQKFSFHPL